MWLLSFAVKRLRARWQSLLTIIVGVFLAAIIGANASLYTGAIAGVGLLQYLNTQPEADTNIYARTSFSPIDIEGIEATRSRYTTALEEARHVAFGRSTWVPQLFDGAETQAMFVLRDGSEVPDVQLRLAQYSGIQEQIIVTEGQFPSTAMAPSAPLPVAIHELAAEELGVTVGDVLELDQRGWESSKIFGVVVVGFVRERDPDAAYWLEPSPLRRELSATVGYQTNLLTTQPVLETVVREYIPQPSVQLNWRLLFPHEQLAVSRLDEIQTQIETFEVVLDEEAERISTDASILAQTSLPTVLDDYGGNIDLLNIPTGLILLQLGALVLFFLVVIAALVRRGERREIALLQSRGAYDRQILLLRGIEALLICALAALAAPHLARAILILLLPFFTGISDIALPLNATVFAYAFGASVVALVVLVATVRPVLRQPLILAGGSAARSVGQTWWQRYYIDVVLLVMGVLAFSQLSQDRVLTTAADGTVQADPLLLLTPALLFIAFSSILLRLFPIAMTLIANLASQRDDLIGVLASWQVSREPLHYGRITFLLALAVGIGGFAVTYQATLRGNDEDQALYTVGSDVRIVYEDDTTAFTVSTLNEELTQQPGVVAMSTVNRIELVSASTGLSTGTSGRGRSRQGGMLLAVDPQTIAAAAYTRPDLGAIIPPIYSGEIPQTGRALPRDLEAITLQIRLGAQIALNFNTFAESFINSPDLLTDTLQLYLRLRDEAGTVYLLPLIADTIALEEYFEVLANQAEEAEESEEDRFEPLQEDALIARDWPDDGWITYTASPRNLDVPLPDQLFFQGIVVQSFTGFSRPYEQARLSLANLEATDTTGVTTPLDWLQPENWSFVNELFTIADAPVSSENSPTGDEPGVMIQWSETEDQATFGLLLDYPEQTSVTNSRSQDVALDEEEIIGIPAFVSRSFAEANDLSIGQRFSIFFNQVRPWFEVAEIIDYYPTLYQDIPYLVVSQDILTYTMQRRPHGVTLPAETWIQVTPEVDITAVTSPLQTSETASLVAEIITTEDILQTFRTDTLSLGIIGLLYLSFVIGIILSAVSLFTYASLSVQARLSEFAILRAMGLPQRRILLMFLLEQALILITSLILGVIVGFFLSTQVLPPLTISAAGGDVTPPYIIRYDLGALLLFGLLIIAVMSFVLVSSGIRLQRSTGADALRFEGE